MEAQNYQKIPREVLKTTTWSRTAVVRMVAVLVSSRANTKRKLRVGSNPKHFLVQPQKNGLQLPAQRLESAHGNK